MTGLVISPDRYDAVIFDLDGVVTDTAAVHAASWKRLFDDFLTTRPPRAGEDRAPFTDADYRAFVDGRARNDGAAGFLAARGIELPWGEPTDTEDQPTVCGLARRKDRYFREHLASEGVRVFGGTVDLIHALTGCGVRTAVVSASRNCAAVLEAAGLREAFVIRVDGIVADELGLPGKPDPATFSEAARRLGVRPDRAIVVEDALAGVEAGRRGGFGLVIGVAGANGHPDQLREHGADVVVADLAEVRLPTAAVSAMEAGP